MTDRHETQMRSSRQPVRRDRMHGEHSFAGHRDGAYLVAGALVRGDARYRESNRPDRAR